MNNKKKILTIDPGTKYIGFALLEGRALIHYGVKTLQYQNEVLKQGKRIILRLIHDFHPDVMIVEKTFFGKNRNAKILNSLTRMIVHLGRKDRLVVSSIATNSVRKVVCDNGEASKDDVARAVVVRFPELKPYLTSNRRWKELYYRNMFDAVALGVAAEKDRKLLVQ